MSSIIRYNNAIEAIPASFDDPSPTSHLRVGQQQRLQLQQRELSADQGLEHSGYIFTAAALVFVVVLGVMVCCLFRKASVGATVDVPSCMGVEVDPNPEEKENIPPAAAAVPSETKKAKPKRKIELLSIKSRSLESIAEEADGNDLARTRSGDTAASLSETSADELNGHVPREAEKVPTSIGEEEGTGTDDADDVHNQDTSTPEETPEDQQDEKTRSSPTNADSACSQDIFRTPVDVEGEPPSLRVSKYLHPPVDQTNPPAAVLLTSSNGSYQSPDGESRRSEKRLVWISADQEKLEAGALGGSHPQLVQLTSSEVSSSTCESNRGDAETEESSVRMVKLNPSDISSSSDGSRNHGRVSLCFKAENDDNDKRHQVTMGSSEVSSDDGSAVTFFKVEKSATLVGRLPSSWWALDMDQIQDDTVDPLQLALFRSERSRRAKRRQRLEQLEFPEDEV